MKERTQKVKGETWHIPSKGNGSCGGEQNSQTNRLLVVKVIESAG